MLWENVAESCDVYQCTRLFKQVFNIKSTPEHPMKLSSQSCRVISMASRRLSTHNASNVTNEISPSYSIAINKENVNISCDHQSSPLRSSPSKIMDSNTKRSRCQLEDFDPNSQDSGYGASNYERDDQQIEKDYDGFRFTEPFGLPPRRISMDMRNSNSPILSPIQLSSYNQRIRNQLRMNFMKKSSSGYESMDDGFNELIDSDNLIDDADLLPKGLNNLLSGPIMSDNYTNTIDKNDYLMECDVTTTPKFQRLGLRRSLSLQNDGKNHLNTPSTSRVRSCLFRSPNATSSASKLKFNDKPRLLFTSPSGSPLLPVSPFSSLSQSSASIELSPLPLKSFKRPEPPTDVSPMFIKKFKKSSPVNDIKSPKKISKIKIIDRNNIIPIKRCLSESDANAHIKSAIHRSVTNSDLTGDFSKPCILPLAVGHHEDLKSITPDTLAKLICGEFNDSVASFEIIDCRYPYEYEAGHIKGAINLYTKDLIDQYLFNSRTKQLSPQILPTTNKRNILVFHCEFSWERGPNLSRYLRNIDRKLNKEYYPALHYPEIYLLHGGYKSFYREQQNLCTPQGYRSMTHPDNEADLRKFRSKSKSWQGEKIKISNFNARANLKILGL